MADSDPEYQGSCGRCYEVQCNPSSFKDNYGEYLDRSSVCYDSSTSVVIQITDTCPCNYPSNWHSNKRWCCGDMPHFDMSSWAFEKLADMKYGVIGVKYRQVSCDTKPWKQATTSSPSPGYSYPQGYQGDKRSCGSAYPLTKDGATTNLNRYGGQPSGSWSSASATSSSGSGNSQASSWSNSGSGSSSSNAWASSSSNGGGNSNSWSSSSSNSGNSWSSSSASSWSSSGRKLQAASAQ